MITPETILENRNKIFEYINNYISEPRKSKLISFYETYDERLTMLPASHKKEYHNAFEGGYYDHINRVIECALDLHNIWVKHGVDTSTYTTEELVFSALNHDLGKLGDEEHDSYIYQTDSWRVEKLGEKYAFNTKLPFASVPDRTLFLLQQNGITYSFNEMIAIQTHDGLYDEGNKKYLMGFNPEQKPRTALPYIIHQADIMAARIEFEKEWLNKLNEPSKLTQEARQRKTLSNIGDKSPKLKNTVLEAFLQNR